MFSLRKETKKNRTNRANIFWSGHSPHSLSTPFWTSDENKKILCQSFDERCACFWENFYFVGIDTGCEIKMSRWKSLFVKIFFRRNGGWRNPFNPIIRIVDGHRVVLASCSTMNSILVRFCCSILKWRRNASFAHRRRLFTFISFSQNTEFQMMTTNRRMEQLFIVMFAQISLLFVAHRADFFFWQGCRI